MFNEKISAALGLPVSFMNAAPLHSIDISSHDFSFTFPSNHLVPQSHRDPSFLQDSSNSIILPCFSSHSKMNVDRKDSEKVSPPNSIKLPSSYSGHGKNSSQPPRPPNSFILYRKDKHSTVANKSPGINVSLLSLFFIKFF